MVSEKQSNKRVEAGDAISPDNPVHTGITKDTASTPGYFRLFLPGLAARYLPRWIVGAENDAGVFGWMFSNRAKRKSQTIFSSLETDATEAQNIEGLKQLQEIGYTGKFSTPAEAYNNAANNRAALRNIDLRLRESSIDIESTLADKRKYAEAIKESTEIEKELSRATTHHDNWEDFKSGVKNTIKKQHSNRWLDRGLGTGSFALTSFYAYRVSSDIKKVFAETVAYETGKTPKDLSPKDFLNSDNVLVQATIKNFTWKNVLRYFSDSIFFLGDMLRLTGLARLNPRLKAMSNIAYADLGVGAKGVQLLMEIQNKEVTVFEYLLQLIDTKLNPVRGIGDHIKPSEIIDLYQKWASIKDPKAAFRDATIYQDHDGMSWGKSEVIFTRVADLLNGTYKYKHPDNNLPIDETAPNFTLPKFLYLLGHNLIDTYQPEKTLAYVEVANRYGIEAVKNMKEMLSRGVDMPHILQKYPVQIDLLKAPERNAAVVPPLVTERHRTPNAVPVSFFPAQGESFSHSNENALAEAPTTKIAGHGIEPEKVASELGEKTRN